jgi:molecular chaperone DnaK
VITAKTDAVAEASGKLMQKMAGQGSGAEAQGTAGGSSNQGNNRGGDDDVVDAEFEEVKK